MRRLSGVIVLLLLGVLLVACGTDEEDPEPTLVPPPVVETEPTVDADVGIPTTPDVDLTDASSLADNPVSSPTVDASTPAGVSDAAATPDATAPVMMEGTPEASPVISGEVHVDRPEMATPIATPAASPVGTPEATPDTSGGMVVPPAGPEATAPPTVTEITGTVELAGVENEAYILTDEGCVGLGQYDDLRDGRQVVVRNELGTIISVTELDAVMSDEACRWSFVVAVPESDFYSVSVPMVFEQVFPRAQVAENDGDVVIELP